MLRRKRRGAVYLSAASVTLLPGVQEWLLLMGRAAGCFQIAMYIRIAIWIGTQTVCVTTCPSCQWCVIRCCK